MKNQSLRKTAAGILSLALVFSSAELFPAPVKAAAGGVSINEVCPKNSTYKASDNGLYDWIELYNNSGSSVDISGWGLTDKESTPYRFTFPDGSSIPAGGRLTVFCDSTAGETNKAIAPFGLSASGETLTLTDKNGSKVDEITFSDLAADTSYGQYPDGSGEYYVLGCTPNAKNSAPEGSNAVRLPEFSSDSGFYSSDISLTITAPSGCTVYYTTDGSDPTTSSEKYSSPIKLSDPSSQPNVYSAKTDISASSVTAPREPVDKAAIIRAVAVDSQGRVSDIVTKTYFIGTTDTSYYKGMKVVSLVTDPDNLFDYEKGIYVKGKVYDEKNGKQQDPGQNPGQGPGQGGPGGMWGGFGDWGDLGGFGGWNMVNPWEMEANYTQHGKEWERPASFELFEDGKSVVSQGVGIRIKGAASRNSAQKSFNVYSRTSYGKDTFEYDFFDGKATKKKNGKVIDSYDGITLRNGGNDNGGTFFRDSVNQSLVADRNMAVETTSECLVFLDGEFWGIYQIIERVSKDYLKSHFGIDKSTAVIIKNGDVEEGEDSDLQDWEQLAKFCADNDMSSDSNYSQVCEKLDIQSYIDYFASQIYWNNADWPQNNFAVWRASAPEEGNPYSDGKWRMFLFDTEFASGYLSNTGANDNAFDRIKRNDDDESKMFISLLKNKSFLEQFELTMMDLINYNFTDEKVTDAINYYDKNFRQQIVDTLDRFGSGNSMFGGGSEQTYNNALSTEKNFFAQRTNGVLQNMQRSLGLTGDTNSITVNSQPSEGTVHVNTISLSGDKDSKWTGKYYSDQTLTITAEPKEGCVFSGWDASGIELTDAQMTNPTIQLKLTGDVNLTAVYSAGNAKTSVKGDYNGDGEFGVADLVTLQSFLVGRSKRIAETDMIEDGKTNAFDLGAVRKELFKK